MSRYIDIIYYIFIYDKEAGESFELEGSPAKLIFLFSLPTTPTPTPTPLGLEVPTLSWRVSFLSFVRTSQMAVETCLLCFPHLV